MSTCLTLQVGKSLWSGYTLRRQRGQGGSGHVWEATDAAGEPVALKFFPCRSDPAAASEVRNLLNLRSLAHPNLLRIDKVWADCGYTVVVMELADGSLADLLELCRTEFKTPVPPDLCCHYLAQAAEALDYLNAPRHPAAGRLAGFQHGNVKPSNLLLCGEPVKLADFNLASPLWEPLAPHRGAGTPDYAAPEVHQGQLSRWSDQYSLAVSYCELRGGRRPFPSNASKARAEFVPQEPDLTMLPADEQAVVARALSVNPRERWKSCGEFLAEVAQVAGRRVS